MDRNELIARVREDAESLSRLAKDRANFPIEEYIDQPDLDALCDSLSLQADNFDVDDLERILVIRDGLYVIRNRLRDQGDDAEHTIDQLLSATDRLYADLERAIRALDGSALEQAQVNLESFRRGPNIATAHAPKTVEEMNKEASEVITQAHASIRHINVNLLKIDRSNPDFEILQSIKISVQRLSASAFAIKLSTEARVIYQGTFKLLTDGADRIVNELRNLLQKFRSSYSTASEFVSELSALADQGTRFSRLVNEFLQKAFSENADNELPDIKLRLQKFHNSEAILGATQDGDDAVLVGKTGTSWTVRSKSGAFDPRFRLDSKAVFSLASAAASETSTKFIAIGTDDGLTVTTDRDSYHGEFRERVVAIVTPPWGRKGSRGTIVTGSKDGVVRRWTLAQNQLTQMNSQAYEEVGRKVQSMDLFHSEIVAATGPELVFLDENMRTTRTLKMPFQVASVTSLLDRSLIVCGEGHLTHVSVDSGALSRILTASNTTDYCCVRVRDDKTFYFGTTDGRVGVMEILSGTELGSVNIQMELRGLLPLGGKILAYGGSWNKVGRSAALLTVEKIVGGGPEGT